MKKPSLLNRIGSGLLRTRKLILSRLDEALRGHSKVDEELLEDLEEILISADVGVQTAVELVASLGEKAESCKEPEKLVDMLKDEMLGILARIPPPEPPAVRPRIILVIGVNGVGKTTTIGKAAFHLVKDGKKVLVAAADTFRAAAIEQLELLCSRAGADLIKQKEGSDPAAVVYDAIHAARSRDCDALIVDTAGRLHTKTNLMRELEKIRRIASKEAPDTPIEGWLILDATTGQNGLAQAREFFTAAGATAVILTKLDGSAKGGIALSVVKELKIPLLYVGVGESVEDLVEFDAKDYVEAMFS
ncbi:signal recognition particle-docking protein FtsY [Acidobacteriota bacterium]